MTLLQKERGSWQSAQRACFPGDSYLFLRVDLAQMGKKKMLSGNKVLFLELVEAQPFLLLTPESLKAWEEVVGELGSSGPEPATGCDCCSVACSGRGCRALAPDGGYPLGSVWCPIFPSFHSFSSASRKSALEVLACSTSLCRTGAASRLPFVPCIKRQVCGKFVHSKQQCLLVTIELTRNFWHTGQSIQAPTSSSWGCVPHSPRCRHGLPGRIKCRRSSATCKLVFVL